MFGDENRPKDVLEYVIFERVLTYPYSQWRVHSKISPSWLPPADPILYTFERPKIEQLGDGKDKDTIEDETKREKISQEQETIARKIPAPNELKTPLPTLSDINQPNRKRTVGYTWKD